MMLTRAGIRWTLHWNSVLSLKFSVNLIFQNKTVIKNKKINVIPHLISSAYKLKYTTEQKTSQIPRRDICNLDYRWRISNHDLRDREREIVRKSKNTHKWWGQKTQTGRKYLQPTDEQHAFSERKTFIRKVKKEIMEKVNKQKEQLENPIKKRLEAILSNNPGVPVINALLFSSEPTFSAILNDTEPRSCTLYSSSTRRLNINLQQ